ncbi:MAG: tRNA (adenosine(37)-N6)-threonylcarbamoyltransferase complex dimerization subunit type 1 TsaB [Acidobacteria bacterium]|nr:MAG: tRNA (adenosine(37)-N6)-threonylcarbamoyltransferase complex dimerization subunit type 1 TsaB [Acidobacteriota bacterium]
MRILAIDTTSEHGGAAVCSGDACLSLVQNEEPASRYAVTLFELADRALAQAGVGFSDIELYAVSNGPGSFTGIRVGLAAAQGWAKAFERPVIGVNLLEAMVERAHPVTDWAVPVLDARRGEFFAGLYRRMADTTGQHDEFEPAGSGQLVHPERLSSMLEALNRGGQCRTYSGGTIALLMRAHDLKARSLPESLSQEIAAIDIPGTLLEAIARVALRAFEQGESSSPGELDACYIRRSDAELNWRPSVVKAGS